MFSPLEALSLSTLSAIVAGVAVRSIMARSFITHEQCEKNHQQEKDNNNHLVDKVEALQRSVSDYQESNRKQFNTLFRMVRGLIVHSALDKETQERILNENGYLSRPTNGRH